MNIKNRIKLYEENIKKNKIITSKLNTTNKLNTTDKLNTTNKLNATDDNEQIDYEYSVINM